MSDKMLLNLARLWYAGQSPVMPGTCGSAVAILLAPWIFMPLPWGWRVVVLLAVFAIGIIACTRAEALLGKKDPQEVVIDELFGQWLVCLPFAQFSFWGYLGAFLLFRLFDITKPYPVRFFEKLPGGFGVMLDDGMAGIYALFVLAGMHWFFG